MSHNTNNNSTTTSPKQRRYQLNNVHVFFNSTVLGGRNKQGDVDYVSYKAAKLFSDQRLSGYPKVVGIHNGQNYYFVSPSIFSLLKDKRSRKDVINSINVVYLPNKMYFKDTDLLNSFLMETFIDVKKVSKYVRVIDPVSDQVSQFSESQKVTKNSTCM